MPGAYIVTNVVRYPAEGWCPGGCGVADDRLPKPGAPHFHLLCLSRPAGDYDPGTVLQGNWVLTWLDSSTALWSSPDITLDDVEQVGGVWRFKT